MMQKFIEQLRGQGIKQAEIIRLTGLTSGYVSKLATGAKPSIDTLILFSDIFHVPIDTILGRNIIERRKGDNNWHGEERRKAPSKLARKTV